MLAKKLSLGTTLLACCLLGAATTWSAPADQGSDAARLAIKELEIHFHEAFSCADYDMMLNLWAEDAVFSNPGGTWVGPAEITEFFASSPLWGKATSLSSNYKADQRVRGNSAALMFECIIVDVYGENPLTTPLSTIPFGAQNPRVEIVQHSNATCTAVKHGNRWVFQSFVGGPGPIMP